MPLRIKKATVFLIFVKFLPVAACLLSVLPLPCCLQRVLSLLLLPADLRSCRPGYILILTFFVGMRRCPAETAPLISRHRQTFYPVRSDQLPFSRHFHLRPHIQVIKTRLGMLAGSR